MTSPWEVLRVDAWRNDVTTVWECVTETTTILGNRNESFCQTCETRDVRICWDSVLLYLNSHLSKHNISCFWFDLKTQQHHHQPHLVSVAVYISTGRPNGQQWRPPASRSSLANPPLAMTNLLHKHPEPITINPTPGNTPGPQASTKTSFSITGESYCPTNLSFLSPKSSGPLNYYVLEFGFSLNWRHHPQVSTSAGAGALVCEGGDMCGAVTSCKCASFF